MIELRELASVIIFCAGIAGIYSLISDAFEWSILLATVLCFVLAYWVWPSKRKGQREEGGQFADILEVLIEFPVDFFLWIVRFIGRFFGGKGDGIDFDI